MEKLGVYDQLFFKADQYHVISMIMGGATVLAPARPGARLDAKAIADHLAARLEGIPLLRVKLVQDPLRLGTVRKVEDPDFNVRDHLSVVEIPAPGDNAALGRCLARLSSEPLPLSKLWHWTVIEGLEDGKLAVDCRIHHALADGVGIVEVLSTIYDAEPVPPEKPGKHSRRVPPPPSPLQLTREALTESAQRLWLRMPKFLLTKTLPALGALGASVRDAVDAGRNGARRFGMPDVHPTSLNISGYSDSRTLSWKTLPLAEVKAMARHFGCKVNDIGLLLFSFAMAHYFDAVGESVDFDLWCAMPLSTRRTGSDAGGNQVTIGRLSLHNTITDAVQRLDAIRRDAQEVKERARPEAPVLNMQDLENLLFPQAIDATMYLAGRLRLLQRLGGTVAFANAIFSNVPGIPAPVFVGNGEVVESIPKIPALEVIAVSGGFTSVEKAITIGFHCDGETVSQPELFVRGVEIGWTALRAAMSKAKRKTRTGTRRGGQRRDRRTAA